MNVKWLVAGILLVVAAGFGVSSFKKSVTPYISFAEAKRSNGTVQVNGVLASKNYVLERDRQFLKFDLKDDHGEVLTVEYTGIIPGNFDQATNIVAIGRYHGGTFAADQLLVKCPSKYQGEGAQHPEGVPT